MLVLLPENVLGTNPWK